jgi:hypothetical protein
VEASSLFSCPNDADIFWLQFLVVKGLVAAVPWKYSTGFTHRNVWKRKFVDALAKLSSTKRKEIRTRGKRGSKAPILSKP